VTRITSHAWKDDIHNSLKIPVITWIVCNVSHICNQYYIVTMQLSIKDNKVI